MQCIRSIKNYDHGLRRERKAATHKREHDQRVPRLEKKKRSSYNE